MKNCLPKRSSRIPTGTAICRAEPETASETKARTVTCLALTTITHTGTDMRRATVTIKKVTLTVTAKATAKATAKMVRIRNRAQDIMNTVGEGKTATPMRDQRNVKPGLTE